MTEPFAFADDLGPSRTVHIVEPALGMKAVLVIDNVAIGPAIGGIRMAPDVTAEEAFRLARAMTFKNSAAGLAHGGGKAVIMGDPHMPLARKEQWIRAFARAIADLKDYIPGPDMGTDEQAMAWIFDEIGRVVGLPREIGGIPLDEIGATGWGVFHAADVAYEHLGAGLAGARVVIQGFGAVGMHAARFLGERGAVLVAAADSRGTLADEKGLDVAALIALKHEGKSVVDAPFGERLGQDAVLDQESDIWIPAARPDVVHAGNVARLRTRIVVQGANIPFTEAAERTLHEQGVLVLPDFIANAGGVICAAVEYHGGSEATAMQTIEEKVRANTRAVLELSQRDGVLPRQAALTLARRRVRRAMELRRFGGRGAPAVEG